MVVLINIYLLVVEGDRQIDIQVYRYIYLSPLTSTIIQTNRYLCLQLIDETICCTLLKMNFFFVVNTEGEKNISTHKIQIETLPLMIESKDNIIHHQNVDEIDCYLSLHTILYRYVKREEEAQFIFIQIERSMLNKGRKKKRMRYSSLDSHC